MAVPEPEDSDLAILGDQSTIVGITDFNRQNDRGLDSGGRGASIFDGGLIAAGVVDSDGAVTFVADVVGVTAKVDSGESKRGAGGGFEDDCPGVVGKETFLKVSI